MDRNEIAKIIGEYGYNLITCGRNSAVSLVPYVRRIQKLQKADCMDCHLEKYEREEVVKHFSNKREP